MMDKLPLEIYTQIAGALHGPDFDGPALATISRAWLPAIEQRTFSEINLRSDDLQRFQNIIHQNCRRHYIRCIRYSAVLPAYNDEARAQFEHAGDREHNDEAFTTAIYDLFQILESWDAVDFGHIKLVETTFLALRRAHRHDLTLAFSDILPQCTNLREIHLDLTGSDCWSPSTFQSNLSLNNSSIDPLSNAIRVATSRLSGLRKLHISGHVDASLFIPDPSQGTTLPELYWQNLEELTVRFQPRRPSGGCYFRELEPVQPDHRNIRHPSETEIPLGYGDVEQDRITAQSFKGVRHFYRRLAELSSGIPGLYYFDIDGVRRDEYYRRAWGVWYLSPNTPSFATDHSRWHPAFSEVRCRRRLIWEVQNWRPNEDLWDLPKCMGQKEHGEGLIEQFVDSWEELVKPELMARDPYDPLPM
ncbi:hypothetical protein F5Y19DRAFT_484352 [Xylariaceae sp. FL1651]|nr:hypothetical protein F5Y19DRAFT_484352 [Xylariaceae sp. FL1651]